MSMTKRYYWDEIIAAQVDDDDCPGGPEPEEVVEELEVAGGSSN